MSAAKHTPEALEPLEALDLVASTACNEWKEPDGSRKCAVDNMGERLWFISGAVLQEVRAALAKATGEQP